MEVILNNSRSFYKKLAKEVIIHSDSMAHLTNDYNDLRVYKYTSPHHQVLFVKTLRLKILLEECNVPVFTCVNKEAFEDLSEDAVAILTEQLEDEFSNKVIFYKEV